MLFPDSNREKGHTKNKSLYFPFKPKDSSKKNMTNRLNSSKDDSILFVENVDIEMLTIDEETKKTDELKLSLEHLYDGFLEQYHKQTYLELITEIEAKEELFYVNSIESFKIYILKIKSIIKMMLNDYYKTVIKNNNTCDTVVKEYSNRILSEFKKLYIIVNKKSKYENEIITQVYCKFLIFLIMYEIKKDNRLKSLAYITLGLNMMKIYFVKDNIATEIKTYFNYIKLLLLFINHLINDKNFIRSLYYINFGFKILTIIFKFISKKNLPKKYYMRAIDYSSFNYIYCGICLEYNSTNLNLSIDSFRQANYFLEKINLNNNSSPFSSIFKKRTNRLKYENIFYLVSNNTIKLIKNELKKIKKEQEMLMLKTKEEKEKEEKLNKNISEKKEKLRLISNGLSTNYKKFLPIQEKIYNKILTPKVNLNIEKFDKELADFIYNKKENCNVSNDIKMNLCRFEMYNELVNEKYRAFIIKNKQLKFNDPSKIRDNLKTIRTFLNINDKDFTKDNKEESLLFNIKGNIRKSKNILKEKQKFSKTIGNFSENNQTPIIYGGQNSIKSYSNKNRMQYIQTDINNYNNNAYKYENEDKTDEINHDRIDSSKNKIKSYSLNVFRNKGNRKIFNIKTYNNISKMKLTKNIDYKTRNEYHNINKSKKFHSYDINLENDFDKNYLDKYLTTKNYQQSCLNYENLIKKELKFQKDFLNIKNYNSKLFFDDYKNQLVSIQENINERNYQSKENALKEFTIINNKVNDEIFGNKADIQKIINDHKKKITNIAQGFKLMGKSAFDDERMKNCMNKVIQRYIIENRKKKMGKFKNYVDNEEIRKKNEKQILKIDNSIKNISYQFYKKKLKIKNPE